MNEKRENGAGEECRKGRRDGESCLSWKSLTRPQKAVSLKPCKAFFSAEVLGILVFKWLLASSKLPLCLGTGKES